VKKTAVIFLATLVLAVSAWLVGSFVVGNRVEDALQAIKKAPRETAGGVRIVQLEHKRSLVGASGKLELVLQPGCAVEPGSEKSFSVLVEYSMSHLILPSEATRFEWQLQPQGSTAEEFKAVFGPGASFAGRGTIGFDGALRTDMSFPELSVLRSGESLQVAPGKGSLVLHGPSMTFDWSAARLVTRGNGNAMEVKDLSVNLDLKNRHLGTGSVRLAAEQVSFGLGAAEGVGFQVSALENGDRLDMVVTPTIRRLKARDLDLSDLALEVAVKGLDTRSVQTLSKIFESSCGMKSMTAEESARSQEAALRLLARGFAIGVSKIGGKSAEGGIRGQLMLELAEAKSGKPSLQNQVKANGQLEVTGALIPPEQRNLAVNMGFAVAIDAGLTAAFDYANGILKLNDRTHDAEPIVEALRNADEKLQALISGWDHAPTGQQAPPKTATLDE
jgi:Bacterial protein of unknown function (DUF945)